MKTLVFFGLILLLGFSGLAGVAAQEAIPWPTTGWPTATPESQGMDSALLAAAYEAALTQFPDLHSLLVIRHGYLVAEMYRYPYTAEMLHAQRSCTKSNTATLMGIAIDEGAIASVDAALLSFFPNQTIAHVDERKQAITLRNLLTMSSGLQWDEGASIPGLVSSPDWTAWMLNRPVTLTPGTRFNYSTGGSNLLAAAIEQATGQTLANYATARLYGPLGITHFQWNREPGGQEHTLGGFGLHMTPRDMAKLGYLYLHQGSWDGMQIVSADWVAAATSPQAPVGPEDDFNYGYQWWLPANGEPQQYFMAQGYGGQLIFVHPDRDLVVVFTAGTTDFDGYRQALVFDHILPAAASDDPLPENPTALERLQTAIQALSQAQAQAVPELPDMAAAISGKTYQFTFGTFYSVGMGFGWKTMQLTFTEGSHEATLNVTLPNDQIVDLRVGLDGVLRTSDVPGLENYAMRGTWTAPDTFRIDLNVLGLPENWTLQQRFVGDEMRITFSEALSGDSHTLIGQGGS